MQQYRTSNKENSLQLFDLQPAIPSRYACCVQQGVVHVCRTVHRIGPSHVHIDAHVLVARV